MRVKFKTTIPNPEYHYGDLNRSSGIPFEGEGEIVSYSDDCFRCIVKTDKNTLHAFALEEITVIEEERQSRRIIRR